MNDLNHTKMYSQSQGSSGFDLQGIHFVSFVSFVSFVRFVVSALTGGLIHKR